jgi:hypothetical protein
MSSKPITDSSPGTLILRSAAARSTPKPIMSLPAKIAEGRLPSSTCAAAAWPPGLVKSLCSTRLPAQAHRLRPWPGGSRQAQLANAGFGGAADIGDVAMAQLQQVAGGQVSALLVVDAHQVGIDAFQLTVDDDHWRAHTGQALQQVVVLAHRGHYQAVDAFSSSTRR